MRVLVCLLLAAPLWGAPDALKTYRTEVRRLQGAEKRFWREFQGRYIEARKEFGAEISLAYAKSRDHPEATYDPAAFERLYGEYEALQRDAGKAADALAASSHGKALDTLWKSLLAMAKEIDRLDTEIREARPMRYYDYDMRPGIARHGIEARRTALIAALAKCPDAARFLVGDGWKKATKGDRKRSITRRVAVLDALAVAGGDLAREGLAEHVFEPETSLRIAAAEGLIGYGEAARPPLAPLLRDGSPLVRRALLQEIRRHAAKDGGWIGPVLALLEAASGRERTEVLLTLAALSNQTFGDAPAKWKAWLDDYATEIKSGKFDKSKIEVQEVKPEPSKGMWTFYGVPTLSRRTVFVVDGGRFLGVPASWKVQRTRFHIEWPGMRTQWEKEHESHYGVLQKQFDKTAKTMPEDLRFGIVGLYGDVGAWPLGEKKLLQPSRRDLAAARKFVSRLPIDGWCGPYLGLVRAGEIGGMGDAPKADFPKARIDTVFLLTACQLRGGRFPAPGPALAALRRFNRFRRLVVHTLRICNEKKPSIDVMKGLAESTGGTYTWLAEPPK